MSQPTHDADLSQVAALILAAGKGTRMKSETPKVLHAVAGRPMLERMLVTLASLGVGDQCVVLSEELGGFDEFLGRHPGLRVAIQKNRQGTGDAVAAAAWSFRGVSPAPYAAGRALRGEPIECRYVLIVTGDTPAVRPETLREFARYMRKSAAAVGVLGMRTPEPKGYGRLVMRDDELLAIVEEKDADAATKLIDICNSGVIMAEKKALFDLLAKIEPNNSQKEYYLTDIVTHARRSGLGTVAFVTESYRDFAGINDRAQLADVERWIVERKLAALMAAGVTCHLPETIYVEPEAEIAPDADLAPGVSVRGHSVVGAGAHIGSNVSLSNATVGAGAQIGVGSVLEHCVIAPGHRVPPLSARLR